MEASLNGRVDVVRALTKAHADINLRQKVMSV